MKFNEIPQVVRSFTQEKLEAREERLSDPALQQKFEQMKMLLKDDVKRGCANALTAAMRITVGAPLSALLEGTKEFGSVVGHNFSVKDSKDKRSYKEVPAAVMAELLTQYGKGVIDIARLVRDLSTALGRATVLGGRYIIGK